ncbi:MAG: hypothetical protein MI892_20715, partial [Desulfobacterales bacterium]|nr:hypothetical protein [Desulfobacterales bacterium]
HNDRWQVVCIETDIPQGSGSAAAPCRQEFVYGNGIDEPLVMYYKEVNDPNVETYYYCSDNIGSVVALVDSSGAVVERYVYDVWGEPTIYDGSGTEINDSAVNNPFMFTAREVDILDGGSKKLQHNRWRIYDYPLARWLQNDPLGTVPEGYMNPSNPIGQYRDGINIYAYVNDNPVDKVDEFGLVSGIVCANCTREPFGLMGNIDMSSLSYLYSICERYKCPCGGCLSVAQCKREARKLLDNYSSKLKEFTEGWTTEDGYSRCVGIKYPYIQCDQYQKAIDKMNLGNGLACWRTKQMGYEIPVKIPFMQEWQYEHHFVGLLHRCNPGDKCSDAILDPWSLGDVGKGPTVNPGYCIGEDWFGFRNWTSLHFDFWTCNFLALTHGGV